MYLENIQSPEDVKKLSGESLLILADEIRDALIKRASVVGSHLGPNLGMVEITVALHKVFRSPVDKIVFDVSHQCYCHKMLTGRAYAFLEKEKYKSVSGYTNPEESEHDLFRVGHTATSISLACGLAKARDCRHGKENVIAVIGDGALSGGEAYEGLNYAKELGSNLIVIVNDNQMSIAENHGALYDNLKLLRETKGQEKCNFFKALGFEYYYQEKGHDIFELCNLFEKVRGVNHPVVLHICTEKGKGYIPAQKNKEMWHWRPPFDIETGKMRSATTNIETYDTILRDYLLDKITHDDKVVAMVAAVPLSIRFTEKERHVAGKQFVDVGIAEEHAITMAAAIAKAGGKPVFTTDCTFFQRAYDQIAQELCINSCPATLLVRNASVTGMTDVTHLGIFDIAMLSNIPNFVYLAPTTKEEYLQMLDWSLEQTNYPVGIRIPKGAVASDKDSFDSQFGEINKFKITNKGSLIAIIAVGNLYSMGREIVELLQDHPGINPTLINPRFVSGLDEEMLNKLRENHEIVITIEDGILSGGFGEKISRFYGTTDMKTMCYGLKKEFLDRYDVATVLNKNRLNAKLIVEDILELL